MDTTTVKEMIFACDRDALMNEYYRNSSADESAGLPDWLPEEFNSILDEMRQIAPLRSQNTVGATTFPLSS